MATVLASAPPSSGQEHHPDQVLEWNQVFIDTLIATNTPNSSSQRLGAIVHTAIFDAYNGIERRYESIFVHDSASPGASRRAAVDRRRAHGARQSVPVAKGGARYELCRLARCVERRWRGWRRVT